MLTTLKNVGAILLIFGLLSTSIGDQTLWQILWQRPAVAEAGSISSPTWSLSDATESATNVTYTHTFTIATALASGDEVRVTLQNQPGSQVQFPTFGTTTASDSTAGLRSRTLSKFSAGPSLVISFTADASVAAGSITVKFGGVTNPSSGGAIPTNTATMRSGSALDGNPFSPDTNGELPVGSPRLTGTITGDTNGDGVGDAPIAGLTLEIHPGPGSTSFFNARAKTNTSGVYTFYGLPVGTFIFEKSQFIDPGSSGASTLSQYAAFEPVTVTITNSSQTLNKVMSRASKIITGRIIRKGAGTAVKGMMINAGSMSGGFASTSTDVLGGFSLRMAVTGPVFFMAMPNNFSAPGGQQAANDTDIGSFQRQLNFRDPVATAETLDLGVIEVEVASATVTGKLLKANGSAMTGGAGLMDLKRHSFIPLQLDSNGAFSAKLVPGGQVRLMAFDMNGDNSPPKKSFTVKKGTNDLGTLSMIANSETVTVKAVRVDGGTERAVANAQAMVFSKDPGPPYFATTNSSGNAIVKVPPGFTGRAGVFPGGQFGGGPKGGGVASVPSQLWQLFGLEKAIAQQADSASDASKLFQITGFQKVGAGGTVTSKFDIANKTVTIRPVDTSGNIVTSQAFIDLQLSNGDRAGAHFGCPTSGGLATCNVVSGKLEGRVMFPPDANYVGKSKGFTVAESGSTVDMEVLTKNATITGSVKDADGNLVKDPNLQVQVGAFGDAFSFGQYNPSNGTYSIRVSAGKWRVGAMADSPGENGYVPSISPKEITIQENKTETFDITLAQLNAKIIGKVATPDGKGVEGVTVTANNTLTDLVAGIEGGPGGPGGPGGGPRPEDGPEMTRSATTDENGDYVIPVAPGDKYTLVVNAEELELFPTGINQAEPKAKETIVVDIGLVAADMKIKVKANKDDGKSLPDSVATVFSENGIINRQNDLNGDGEGTVSLPSKDSKGNPMVYYLKVGKDTPEENKSEESSLVKIIGEKDAEIKTTLQTAADTNLASPTTVEVSSSASATANLTKGSDQLASVTLPAGAASGSSSSDSSSTGTSMMTVTPIDAELPLTKTEYPVGGLEVDLTDGSNTITSLNGVATIEIEYDQNKLPAGVSESNLAIKYYNPSTKQYEAVQSTTVDTATNTVKATTNHFSQFAIVATTDTTAPSAPTSVKAVDKTTGGAVALSWTNPTNTDFKSVTIYRSTVEGTVGTAVYTGETGTTKDDTGLTDGTKYYYVIRSIDTTGNESANTTQVSVTPTTAVVVATPAPTLPKTGAALSQVNIFGPLTFLISLLMSAYVISQFRHSS